MNDTQKVKKAEIKRIKNAKRWKKKLIAKISFFFIIFRLLDLSSQDTDMVFSFEWLSRLRSNFQPLLSETLYSQIWAQTISNRQFDRMVGRDPCDVCKATRHSHSPQLSSSSTSSVALDWIWKDEIILMIDET